MQAYKRDTVNQFWSDYVIYTSGAICSGAFLAFLLSNLGRVASHPIRTIVHHPIMPLYAGIAGGLALSQCATKFNELQHIENKIVCKKHETREFNDRLERLRLIVFLSQSEM